MKKNKLNLYRIMKKRARSNNQIKMKTVKWQSKEYFAGIDLRNNNLKKPSGLTLISSAPIQEELAIHLVAIIKGQVVATLFLDQTEHENVAQIKQVAVSPDFRGRNIGKQLMQYAEAVATRQGYHEIILDARESATPFYEKIGYSALGDGYQVGTVYLYPYYKRLANLSKKQSNYVA